MKHHMKSGTSMSMGMCPECPRPSQPHPNPTPNMTPEAQAAAAAAKKQDETKTAGGVIKAIFQKAPVLTKPTDAQKRASDVIADKRKQVQELKGEY